MQDNLQIPYGIFDFKRIRTEGYCYDVAEEEDFAERVFNSGMALRLHLHRSPVNNTNTASREKLCT